MSQRPTFLPLAFPWLIPVISLEFLSYQMMYPAKEVNLFVQNKGAVPKKYPSHGMLL